mmetsp:Transcript_5249/g.13281  ORF Transcript_5249/g.13281 Transcript_5249/m.13281 type:complete len:226 (-) Transcript_5249:198-875(-)
MASASSTLPMAAGSSGGGGAPRALGGSPDVIHAGIVIPRPRPRGAIMAGGNGGGGGKPEWPGGGRPWLGPAPSSSSARMSYFFLWSPCWYSPAAKCPQSMVVPFTAPAALPTGARPPGPASPRGRYCRLVGSRSCPSPCATSFMEQPMRTPRSSSVVSTTFTQMRSSTLTTPSSVATFSASLSSRVRPRWSLTCELGTRPYRRQPSSCTKRPYGLMDFTVASWML